MPLHTISGRLVTDGVYQSKLVFIKLIFVLTKVRINGRTNTTTVNNQCLPATHKIDGRFFTSNQDSAQVHRVCETVNLFAFNFAK